MISGINKVEVGVNNCFIIHCFKENNDKPIFEEANRRDMFCLRCVRDATHHP